MFSSLVKGRLDSNVLILFSIGQRATGVDHGTSPKHSGRDG